MVEGWLTVMVWWPGVLSLCDIMNIYMTKIKNLFKIEIITNVNKKNTCIL